MKYSVFISYRREGAFDTACLIAEKLRNRGYSVFLDVESMRSGKFNEQLYLVIGQCRDFVLVLPQGGLDRCLSQDDWLRLEIMHAMKLGKNIIPVMLKGFSWPEKMPEGLEGLDTFQGIAAGDIHYFDSAIDKLVSYLSGRPSIFSRKPVRYSLIALLLLCIVVSGFFVFRSLSSVPVCREQVSRMVAKISVIDALVYESDNIYETWSEFYDTYTASPEYYKAELVNEMRRHVEYYTREVMDMRRDTAELILSGKERRLLHVQGLDPSAVELFVNSIYPSFFDDIHHQLELIGTVLDTDNISDVTDRTIEINAEMFRHNANAVYYSFLFEIVEVSEKALDQLVQVSPSWMNLPSSTSLHLPKEEYERLQNAELKKSEDLVSEVGYLTTEQLRQLDMAKERMDLEVQKAAINSVKQDIDERIDRVVKKVDEVTAKQKELQKTASMVDSVSMDIMEQCRLVPEDGQWLMWGKIVRLGKLLKMRIESQDNEAARKTSSDWFEPVYRVTPQVVLDRILQSLDQFLGYFPEASTYVPQAKEYFSEVAGRSIPHSGMLVIATKDDKAHPVLRVGDIVVERNGRVVNTSEDFSNAKNSEGEDRMTYLRLEDGRLLHHTDIVPKNDVLVALLPLTE